MPTPRRKTPAKAPRPAPHVRQQGAWGTRHHSAAPHQFDAQGQRLPKPGVGQRTAEFWQRRRDALATHNARTAKLAKPARRGAASARSRWNARTGTPSRSTRSRPRRRRPRRGALFGVFTVAVAAVCLTALTIELVSTVAASELFFAAETIAAGTAWWLGEPAPPTQRSARPAGKGGYVKGGLCGAPTADKSPCQNPIKAGTAGCHHHSGNAAPGAKGKSKTKTATAPPPAKAATP